MERSVFEMPHYIEISVKREQWLSRLLDDLDSEEINTAIDVGCGQGYFTNVLHKRRLEVAGTDGRELNVEEAKRKYPMINFVTEDIENQGCSLGSFDLVVCLGLLYHLENPSRAIRNLFKITKKILVIETRVVPSKWPILVSYDEVNSEDQGLNFAALIPSLGCLVKMLYNSGYNKVYRTVYLPDHPDFKGNIITKQARICLIASMYSLNKQKLISIPKIDFDQNYWHRWLFRKMTVFNKLLGK